MYISLTNTIGALRQRVTSSPSFVGLLNTYGGATIAYSFRQLDGNYTGSAIRVRRSSDNTEQDIGFANNVLDTVSLLTFVGSGDGFVTTWYDQSGNANNAINSSAADQPKIVSSGVIVLDTDTGKQAITYPLNTSRLYIASSIPLTSDWTYSMVSKAVSSQAYSLMFGDATGVANNQVYVFDGQFRTKLDGTNRSVYGLSGNRDSTRLWLSQRNSANTLTVNRNALTYGNVTGATGTFNFTQIGSNLSVNNAEFFSELIIWASEKSTSDVTGIETNINDYYSIY